MIAFLQCIFLSIVCLPGFANNEDAPVDKRMKIIQAMISEKPEVIEQIFHPDFLAQVPISQLLAITEYYYSDGGAVAETIKTKSEGKFYGEYSFQTDNGMIYPVKIGLDEKAPHKIKLLWFGMIKPQLASIEQFLEKLKSLEGEVSFAFYKLDDDKSRMLWSYNPEKALAIGSAFKLYILGELINRVNEKSLSWADVTEIKENLISFPSGILHSWPVGSPLTLHTLAAEMISISDNTATDHLLFYLGRKKVENTMKEMGNKNLVKNIPFLSTQEMFRIKEKGHAAKRVSRWLAEDTKGRRDFLLNEISIIDRKTFNDIDGVKPTAISDVEWFASASELCHAMNWLRKHTSGDGDRAIGATILSINPGLTFEKSRWPYVGYKGGSEPGVLNLTWLLKRNDNHWFALSCGVNNTEKTVDEAKFTGLIQSFIDIVSKEKKDNDQGK